MLNNHIYVLNSYLSKNYNNLNNKYSKIMALIINKLFKI